MDELFKIFTFTTGMLEKSRVRAFGPAEDAFFCELNKIIFTMRKPLEDDISGMLWDDAFF
jgi:hypothetical protein